MATANPNPLVPDPVLDNNLPAQDSPQTVDLSPATAKVETNTSDVTADKLADTNATQEISLPGYNLTGATDNLEETTKTDTADKVVDKPVTPPIVQPPVQEPEVKDSLTESKSEDLPQLIENVNMPIPGRLIDDKKGPSLEELINQTTLKNKIQDPQALVDQLDVVPPVATANPDTTPNVDNTSLTDNQMAKETVVSQASEPVVSEPIASTETAQNTATVATPTASVEQSNTSLLGVPVDETTTDNITPSYTDAVTANPEPVPVVNPPTIHNPADSVITEPQTQQSNLQPPVVNTVTDNPAPVASQVEAVVMQQPVVPVVNTIEAPVAPVPTVDAAPVLNTVNDQLPPLPGMQAQAGSVQNNVQFTPSSQTPVAIDQSANQIKKGSGSNLTIIILILMFITIGIMLTLLGLYFANIDLPFLDLSFLDSIFSR